MGKNKMRVKGVFVLAEHTVNRFGKPVQRGKSGQWREMSTILGRHGEESLRDGS